MNADNIQTNRLYANRYQKLWQGRNARDRLREELDALEEYVPGLREARPVQCHLSSKSALPLPDPAVSAEKPAMAPPLMVKFHELMRLTRARNSFHHIQSSQYPLQAPNRGELRVILLNALSKRNLEPREKYPIKEQILLHSFRQLSDFNTVLRETSPLPEEARAHFVENLESPQHPPLLVHSSTLSTAEMTQAFCNTTTLVVTDEYNYPKLQHLNNVMVAMHSTLEEVNELKREATERGSTRIIGVGGGLALDMAKAVGLRKELIVLPTILSTNCISTNRSVLGSGLSSFSFRTGSPMITAVSMKDLMAQDAGTLRRWSQSGFGDLFAEISSAIDAEAATGTLTLNNVKKHDPEVMDALHWVASSFNGYGPATLEKLSTLLHESGLKVLDEGTNQYRIGGEHMLYKALMEVNPKLRNQGPTHGQIVAVGALLTAHIFTEKTGDRSLYNTMHKAFAKLGLPITWKQLADNGMSRDDLVAGLKRIAVPTVAFSVLGNRVRSGNLEFLDEVLSPPALGKTWKALTPNPQAASVDWSSPIVRDTGSAWDREKFKEGRGPLFVANVDDPSPLRQDVGHNVFHLPIKLPGTGYRLPDELAPFAPIIQKKIDHEHAINPNVDKLYALLTVDQGYVIKGGSQRRGGLHVDDFQWGKLFPKQQVDHSYVLTSFWAEDPSKRHVQNSTEFFPQPVNLDGLDETKDDIHKAFNAQVDTKKPVTAPPDSVNLMDAYCIHQAPVSDENGFRTFIRLSFSPRQKQGDESRNLAFE